MNTIKKWLTANAEAIPDILIVGIGALALIVVIWLDVSGGSGTEITRGVTLVLLTLLGASLLIDRRMNSRLLQAIEDLTQRSQTTNDQLRHMLEETNSQLQATLAKMRKPSASQIIAPYSNFAPEIDERLTLAQEVWVLSRTCTRLWEYHNAQFAKVLKAGGTLRFMLVDPEDGALKMISDSAEHWDLRRNGIEHLRAQVENLLTHLTELKNQHRLGSDSLQIRVLDYLPAWTLLFIDPNSDKAMVFVEFATFRADPRNRPAVSVTMDRDRHLFEVLQTEYETMWKNAKTPAIPQGASDGALSD